MSNITRSNFQAHPFHLVSPSPWPIYTCIALFALTTSGVLTIHGFSNVGGFLMSAFLSVILSMSFWWRDVISEGKLNTIIITLKRGLIKVVRAISFLEISLNLETRIVTHDYIKENELGYYLAGLLEGDGHISIPGLGNSTLNRVPASPPLELFLLHI